MPAVLKMTLLAAAIVFVALAVLSKGWLEPGGQLIFDSRVTGYTPEVARAYLGALSPAQRDLYLGAFRVLDTVFPVLLTIGLGALIWRAGGFCDRAWQVLFASLPGVYLVLDLAENAAVAAVLRTGVAAPDALIQQASMLTMAKWVALGLVGLSLGWLWWSGTRKERR